MMRQAISPRLAIRILRNIAPPIGPLAGLVPAIHVLLFQAAPIQKTWVPGTSPGTGCWFGWPRKTSSQRDVVVLLPRVCELFVAQHGERAAEAPAGVGRLDHVGDKATA